MADVRFENITIELGGRTIINDLNLQVEENEILGLVGPSASGKTTIIRALCGFVRPTTGNIWIGDRLVFSVEQRVNIPPEKRNIGVVFQDYAVWPHMTVWENVIYPLKKRKIPKDERERRAKDALEKVRMSGYGKHMPAQLSGGQQQRVAIARALVSSDDLIVLDEPITNLDAKLREEMVIEIQSIQREIGTTIIYITHDQETALKLCDRIAIMNATGDIVQIGSDMEIIKQPVSRYVFSFIGVSNFIPVTKKEDKIFLNVGQEIPYLNSIPLGYPDSGNVEMGIRPMDIIFDDNSAVKGTVTQSVFLGNQYNFFVTLGNQAIRVEQNALEAASVQIPKNGAEVGLQFISPRFYQAEGGEL